MMKKRVVVSGNLRDMVKYCTAIYEIGKEINADYLQSVISDSPIFEDKSFHINVLGTVSKTSVARKSKLFVQGNIITVQISYEILKVVDIDLTEKDENWIDNDIKKLLEHFELLIEPFSIEES
jgi:hypothetical protein